MTPPSRGLFPIAAVAVSAVAFYAVALMAPLSANAQTATDLNCKGCVGKRDIGKKAITSKHIKDGKIKPKDLSNDAKPAAVAVSEKIDLVGTPITTTPAVYRTVTIEAPGPGAVIANYFGTVHDPSATVRVACGASTETTVSGTDMLVVAELSSPPEAQPLSGTKVFEVADAGPLTVNFVCFMVSGTAKMAVPHLSLLFVPGTQSIVTESDAAESASASSAGLLAE